MTTDQLGRAGWLHGIYSHRFLSLTIVQYRKLRCLAVGVRAVGLCFRELARGWRQGSQLNFQRLGWMHDPLASLVDLVVAVKGEQDLRTSRGSIDNTRSCRWSVSRLRVGHLLVLDPVEDGLDAVPFWAAESAV